ncbi:MAG: M14 family zinc carboxypeptidase [Thermoplasmatota archaeon]
MRAAALLIFLLLAPLAPTASAGLGHYGHDGWPVNVDGESTNPVTGGAWNQVGPATLYPYYPILSLEVQRLADLYPDRVRLHEAGTSTVGLSLWMLEIADFAAIEAGEGMPLEEREVVWVDGGTHSNEYSGVYFTLAWAQYLIEGYGVDDNATWIVDNRHTWILPMVNPDGSNAMGRLNANLVNINRNYPVVWDGQGNDALMNNRGPHPASEIETQITIEWYNKTQPDYMASIHCCGNLWLYPYGEEGVDPPADDFAMLEQVCDLAFPDVREACGPIWSTIYPASGSSVDTAYEYTGAVAFGYEMSGRGAVSIWGQPITVEDVQTQERESWYGLLHAFLNVHRYGGHPVIDAVAADGDDGLRVTVRNDGLGNLTAGTLRFEQDGRAADVALPRLAPGEVATLELPADARLGEATLALDYQKRAMAAPQGVSTVPLVFVRSGDAMTQEDADVLTVPLGDEGSAIPGAGPALALLALAALALIVGRNGRLRP